MSDPVRLWVCCLAVMALGAIAVPLAQAQRAYVTNFASGSVSLFDTATNAPQGAIPVGNGPTDIAITPDGTRAYVANAQDDTVSAIDIPTNAVVATIPVGDEPRGIAIAPNGTRVYVANTKSNSVSVISTATPSNVGPAIAVGAEPEGIAITPDGLRSLVAQRGGDISVIENSTASVVSSIPDALGPARLAISPDGTRGFAANKSSNSVTIFSLTTGTVLGAPILAGANPSGLALSSNGPAYVSSTSDNTVVAIDPINHARIGPPISGFAGPSGIAATADGSLAYVANSAASSVSVIDAASASVKGEIPVGSSPRGIALVPDQPPHASFLDKRAEKRGQVIRFDASSTTDSDSQVATYAWDFGDGQGESGPSPQVEHTYARPGSYQVTLTVTDAQGCSVSLAFTGQTASCNGSGIARASTQVKALDTIPPAFRFTAAHRQPLGPRVTLKARCPQEDCMVSIAATLDTVAKAKRGRGSTHLPAARAKVSIPSGGKATIRLRLTKKALGAGRRNLRSGGLAALRVTAIARDVAGNKATRKLGVELLFGARRGAAGKGRAG